jgi:uncharacterized membrane protein
LFSNRTIERHAQQVGHAAMQVAMLIFAWGLAWWVLGGLHEIHMHVPRPERNSAALLFLAGTCAAFSALFGRGWWIARFPALALAPVMALVLVARYVEWPFSHPLAGFGLIAWPAAFALHFLILRRDDTVRSRQPERGVPELAYLKPAHAAGVWLIALAGAWEAAWQIDRVVAGHRVWPLIGWALIPVVLLWVSASRRVRAAWPVRQHPHAYLWLGGAPLAAYLWLWALNANWSSNGDPAPLPYVPLINPLDIAHLLVFGSAIAWWQSLRASEIEDAKRVSAAWSWGLLGAAIFVWLNGVLLRTLHHWGEVPYDLEAILRSDLAQTALSVFWTVLALACMLFATRRGYRALWITGAALMAVVVIKLFVMDLAKVGGVERIVSFIAVGVLMLVIGYVAPVPPSGGGREK